jgi:hypothetical protein
MTSSMSEAKRASTTEQESHTIGSTKRKSLHSKLTWTLQRRPRALLLIAFYIPLLVIPWTLTCIMIHRPLRLPQYIKYRCRFAEADFDQNEQAQTWVDVLNSIRAIVTIPLVGAVLAQTVVVYTQRKRKSQKLQLYETFTLADRSWSDPLVVIKSMTWKQGNKLLITGAAIVLLCKWFSKLI